MFNSVQVVRTRPRFWFLPKIDTDNETPNFQNFWTGLKNRPQDFKVKKNYLL